MLLYLVNHSLEFKMYSEERLRRSTEVLNYLVRKAYDFSITGFLLTSKKYLFLYKSENINLSFELFILGMYVVS